MCKSVLVGIYMVAFGVIFLSFCCCEMIVVLGVMASLPLGREEKPWGEGVSWACH